MPALRSRQHLVNGKKTNGFVASNSNGLVAAAGHQQAYLNKKLLLLEEEHHQAKKKNNNNSNGIKTTLLHEDTENGDDDDTATTGAEEVFLDTQTMGAHCNKPDDEEPAVFSERDYSSSSSLGKSVRDQFAVALLRLQTDLDSTSRRLTAIEGKVDELRRSQNQRDQRPAGGSGKRGAGSRLFNRDNLTSLVFLSWPVVVFLAIRAIERRSIASGKMA